MQLAGSAQIALAAPAGVAGKAGQRLAQQIWPAAHVGHEVEAEQLVPASAPPVVEPLPLLAPLWEPLPASPLDPPRPEDPDDEPPSAATEAGDPQATVHVPNAAKRSASGKPEVDIPCISRGVALLHGKRPHGSSRPLEATAFEIENIRMAYVFYESGLSINVMYTVDDPKKRAVGFKLSAP